MNEKSNYCYLVIGIVALALLWICTSSLDGRGSEDIGSRIVDSEAINQQLQDSNRANTRRIAEVESHIGTAQARLGTATEELDRATASIERCEQIIDTATRRTQTTSQANQ